MDMRTGCHLVLTVLGISALWLSSCVRMPSAQRLVVFAPPPVEIPPDTPDAPEWRQYPAYPLRTAGRRTQAPVYEQGIVRLCRTDDALFLNIQCEDTDVVQEARRDNAPLYQFGDTVEVFLRPPGGLQYWEFLAGPDGTTAAYCFPSEGRRLPSCLLATGLPGLSCQAAVDGTLNEPEDRDRGWRCVVRIPLAALARERPLDFSRPWLFMVARYNYSIYLEHCELTQIGQTRSDFPDFHNFDSYSLLYFTRPK